MKGSVYRRGKVWRAIIDLPHREGDRRKQKSRTCKTRKEAEEWLARTGVEWADGFVDPGDLSVESFLHQWLEAVAPSLKPNTLDKYARTVRRWEPLIGRIPIAKLHPMEIQRAVNGLGRETSPGTVRTYFNVLRIATRQGVAWRILGRDPTQGVKLPRDAGREMRCWSEAECGRFLRYVVETTRYAALFRLALASGMRCGELLALRWADVDWPKSAVRVGHSLAVISTGEYIVTEPKTRCSRRTLDLDAGTMSALRHHQRQQAAERLAAGPAWTDLGLVFPTRTGGYVNPTNLRKQFGSFVAGAGVPRIRIHDLRHTHATLLLRQGRNLREVAERLGHTDPAITLRVYSHVLPDQRTESARLIGRVLDSSGESM